MTYVFHFSETYTVSKRENDIFGELVKKLMNTIEQLMTMSSGWYTVLIVVVTL